MPTAPATYVTKFVRPAVVVVHRFSEVAGQRGANNAELPNRRIHRLMVLTKDSGLWRIVSELVMDERQDRPNP
ncbi:MAG: hypothetical protein HYR63_14095 [Proteobacteria bacterium]|nr:hypothetical protein [Pseudomonadota bacterium]